MLLASFALVGDPPLPYLSPPVCYLVFPSWYLVFTTYPPSMFLTSIFRCLGFLVVFCPTHEAIESNPSPTDVEQGYEFFPAHRAEVRHGQAELPCVRMSKWAKANLGNPVAKTVIITYAAGMAYFIAGEKKVVELSRKHSLEAAKARAKSEYTLTKSN
uniref:HIG1 domain-containing protein n=1 Tax=Oryza barthii TaxID=65489 RepID=A0A0D3GCL9_9ORYZ